MDGKQLVDEFQRVWAQMKDAMERKADQVQIDRLNARLDHMEVANQRLPLQPSYDPTKRPSEEGQLFCRYVASGGPQGLRDPADRAKADALRDRVETKLRTTDPSEYKALSLGDDSAGGFLAPSDFAQEIIKGVQLISPIARIARVRPTSGRSVQVPVRAGVFAASWVGEQSARTETTGLKYSMEELPIHEEYAYIVVSLQDLEDSSFDMQQEIASEAAEQFAKAEGAAFVNGDSLKKPEGFMVASAVEHVPSGDANLITADGLINLVYGLKSDYARNASMCLNRKSIGAIRKLKDPSSGSYLWQPGLIAGNPSTILDLPIVECPDMDDIAAGKFPVCIGDFRRGYMIVERLAMTVQRLVEINALQGQVVFLVRRRVGGQVVLPEALLKLEIAAS